MLEIAGAATVFIIVPMIYYYGSIHFKAQKFWISSALLSMGIIDFFHALAPIGNLFVWLHTLATLFGGVLFLGAILPHKFSISSSKPLLLVMIL